MTIKQIETELRIQALESHKNWGKICYYVKKEFDDWATDELAKQGYPNFKMMYMPFLMNINVDGNTNKEIANKGRVSKQAMSKVVKELETLGLIKVDNNQADKRSAIIFLTNKGKKMVYTAKKHVQALTNEYKEIMGIENYNIMLEGLIKIIAYHADKKANEF